MKIPWHWLLGVTLILGTVVVLAALQTSLWFLIFGHFPPPMFWLVTLVYVSVSRPLWEATMLTYLICLPVSAYTIFPFAALLVFSLALMLIMLLIRERMYWGGPTYFMLMVSAATLTAPALFWLVSRAVDKNPVFIPALFDWLISALLTMLTSFPLYRLYQWFDHISTPSVGHEGRVGPPMSDALQAPEDEAKEYLPRYRLLYAAVIVGTLLIAGRLWFLQILHGSEMRQFSEKNRVKETKLPAPRGLFLDRENRVLVDNLPGYDTSVSPQYAKKLDATSEAVGGVINVPGSVLAEKVRKSQRRDGPFRPVKIKDNLSLEEVFRLKLLRWDFPGLNINESILRYYNLNENGAQLFGYLSEISKEQIPKYNDLYQGKFTFEQGDIIGKSGLEEAWDTTLRGRDGISYVEVDARGREAPGENSNYLGFKPLDAVPGYNLVLTIDKDIQEAAYKAMNRQDHIGPRIGGVVVMKADGEILAWVNTPSFDPNKFTTGIPPQVWAQLINDPFRPLRNKLIQDHFSPGSTFKPIVALAALQEKVVTPNQMISVPMELKFGRRIYHNSHAVNYGALDIKKAIEVSSNIFFYKMGIALGIDRMAPYAKLLGLGQKTDISLANEVSGLIPTAEWKVKKLGEEWQPGENLSVAIGQGYVLVTALQMAVAYNAIGLEGPVVKPFLIKKILNQDSQLGHEFKPKILRDATKPNEFGVTIDTASFKTVKEGMRRVVNGEGGTARASKLFGVEMAGKTGTTQVRSFSAEEIYKRCDSRPIFMRHHGWFVGFAPLNNPEITVAVLAQHSCGGAAGAAPVAHDIMMAYFQKYHPELVKAAAGKTMPVVPLPATEDQEAE